MKRHTYVLRVLRIRVNPRLGNPNSWKDLVVCIVHEMIHVAVARDGKFSATDDHGMDFKLYAALASEKTGLVIPETWDDAEIVMAVWTVRTFDVNSCPSLRVLGRSSVRNLSR